MKILSNRCCSVYLLFFVLTNLYAQEGPEEIRGTLSFDYGPIVHGHIVDATLHINSIDQETVKLLTDSREEPFLNHFFIVDILETDFFDGRLKWRLKLAVRESFGKDWETFWKYGDKKIPITIEKVNVESFSGKERQFKILVERVPPKQFYSYIKFLLATALIMVFLFLAVRFQRTRKRKKEWAKREKQDRERLLSLMKNMESKEELQKFYENKDKIKGMLGFGHKEFKKIIQKVNKHQYKDNVSKEQMVEIREQIKKLLANGI